MQILLGSSTSRWRTNGEGEANHVKQRTRRLLILAVRTSKAEMVFYRSK